MNYEQHVRQNNERLICIKQALQDQSTFVAAAKELLEWCLDPRAFQKPFEDNIIGCLNIVVHVAKCDGFDLNLSCRLLSVCANYREKFSPHFASAISKWNEDLSQTILSRHRPETSTNSSKVSITSTTMDPNKMIQKSSTMINGPQQQDMIWQGGPGGSVSVVTTVYSGVSGFSANGQQSYSAANTTMYGGHMPNGQGGYGGGQNMANMQKTPSYDNGYQSYSHQSYHPGNTPEYGAPGQQATTLNVAQVAAAAVATATATATAVALDQSQYQQYPVSQNAYGTQQYTGGPVGMMHGQYGNQRMMPSNGLNRPQMPPNYGAQAVRSRNPHPSEYQQQGGGGKMVGNMCAPPMQMGPGPYNVTAICPRGPGYGVPMMVANGAGPVGTYRQRYPANNVRSPQYGMVSQQNGAYANGYSPINHVNQQPVAGQHMISPYGPRMYSAMNSAAPGTCPGNPTPPMTPVNGAGLVSPPGYPSTMSPANNALSMDLKPAVNCQPPPDDDRLTTAVSNGVIMTPFRLEHNSPVTQHYFVLNEQMYNFLASSPDNDLQLKCFHQDDKSMSCHWPANANVQICMNGTPVSLFNNEKPLFLRSLCQMNKNVLQISVQQCSCSHLFILSLVQRPQVMTIKDNLLRRKLLPQDLAMEKIKRFFHSGDNSSMRSVDGQMPDIEQMSINMTIKCPISMQKIELPARGQQCRHPQCFDVETFLKMNKDRTKWSCPICKNELHLDSLEIDQYVWGIITNLKETPVDEVSIDNMAMWKPLFREVHNEDNGSSEGVGGKVKQESSGQCSNPKRFKTDSTSASGQNNSWPTYAAPHTPVSASITSPSYYQINSPANSASIQRQRNTNELSTPQSNNCGSNNYPPTPRQSMGPRTPQQSSNGKMGPLTPVTPLVSYNPPSVGQPRSVGNPPSVETAHAYSTHQQSAQNVQIDSIFPSSSAPYTPASVSSNGSQYGNGNSGNATLQTDVYGQDLYDIENFLTESSTSASNGLFADSMDPLELLKYLDNGETTNDAASSSTRANQQRGTNASSQSSQEFNGAKNNRSSGSSLDNSSVVNDLNSLDAVLSFLT